MSRCKNPYYLCWSKFLWYPASIEVIIPDSPLNTNNIPTHLENKKRKRTGQKSSAVDKRIKQLGTFVGVLYQWWYFGLILAVAFFFFHFQLLCEWTKCNKGGFLEPWSAGHLCHSCTQSPGGALFYSIIPVFSFQGFSRESGIKYNFSLAINRDPQSLGAAIIVN